MLAMNILEVTIDELVERYSALLFDAYGVLSYTVGALPGAVWSTTTILAALRQLLWPLGVWCNCRL